ncbi:hypothetical protein Tsubulata_033848 [Turnera subulata]|uniref:Cytochrome b561 domain-containing protein n=1 Tax=Turnera subulata TaxID=218843 RepID=A0A9Q0FRE4_9ROSI|nr:hypothetical protein Tsubulata_033848 [Turnera subulata]
MATPPPVVRFPMIALLRVIGLMVAALVIIWGFHFRGGLALSSDDKALIFNVHPVLLVIGLVLLNGEGNLYFINRNVAFQLSMF